MGRFASSRKVVARSADSAAASGSGMFEFNEESDLNTPLSRVHAPRSRAGVHASQSSPKQAEFSDAGEQPENRKRQRKEAEDGKKHADESQAKGPKKKKKKTQASPEEEEMISKSQSQTIARAAVVGFGALVAAVKGLGGSIKKPAKQVAKRLARLLLEVFLEYPFADQDGYHVDGASSPRDFLDILVAVASNLSKAGAKSELDWASKDVEVSAALLPVAVCRNLTLSAAAQLLREVLACTNVPHALRLQFRKKARPGPASMKYVQQTVLDVGISLVAPERADWAAGKYSGNQIIRIMKGEAVDKPEGGAQGNRHPFRAQYSNRVALLLCSFGQHAGSARAYCRYTALPVPG